MTDSTRQFFTVHIPEGIEISEGFKEYVSRNFLGLKFSFIADVEDDTTFFEYCQMAYNVYLEAMDRLKQWRNRHNSMECEHND